MRRHCKRFASAVPRQCKYITVQGQYKTQSTGQYKTVHLPNASRSEFSPKKTQCNDH
jgi:hypothetical protein